MQLNLKEKNIYSHHVIELSSFQLETIKKFEPNNLYLT